MPRIDRKTMSFQVPTVDQPTRKLFRVEHGLTILTSARRVMNYAGFLTNPTPVLSQLVKGWDTSKSYSLTFYYNAFVTDITDQCTLSVFVGDNLFPPYLFLNKADSLTGWKQWTIPYLSAKSAEEKLSFRYECVPIEPRDRYQTYLYGSLYLDDLVLSENRNQSPF